MQDVVHCILIVDDCVTFADVLLTSFCKQQQDRQQLVQLLPEQLEHQ